MKKIIALILLSFSLQSQTLIKTKQIGDGLSTGSVVVTGGTGGSLTYSATSSLPFTPSTRSITINGITYNLSADRTWTVGDLYSTSSYSNPSWLTSLSWSKISGTPTTLSGYGITDAITSASAASVYLPKISPAYTGTLTTGTLTFTDTNVLAAFQSSVNGYNQMIIQNSSTNNQASADVVIGTDDMTATNKYLNLGKNSSTFTGTPIFNAAGAGYLYTQGVDLAIGTSSTNAIHLAANNGSVDAITISSSNSVTLGGQVTMTNFSTSATSTLTGTQINGTETFSDAINIAVGTTTGTKFGTATSQKIGFFNATPVVQQAAATDLGTVLSNLGFRSSGTAYPITTTGAVSHPSLTSPTNLSFGTTAQTSGSLIPFLFSVPSNTGMTASTNVPMFKVAGNLIGHLTGNYLLQYDYYLSANSHSAVAATQIGKAYGLYVESPIQSTNVTFTNTVAGIGTNGVVEANAIYGTGGNWTTGGGSINTPTVTSSTGVLNFNATAQSSGSLTPFAFNVPASSALTASANVSIIKAVGTNIGHSTGTSLNQYDYYLSANTHSVVGASTFSNVVGLYVEKPIAGTNSTFTNVDAIQTNGGIKSTSKTDGIGYAVGSGSTVTQATSRTTGVTINSITGSITLFSAAGSTAYQSFTVTNSAVTAKDVVVVNQQSGTDLNIILVTAVSAGSFKISFATTGGTTVETPVFNFAVIKGQTN